MGEMLNEYLPAERKLIQKTKIVVSSDEKPWAEAHAWNKVITVSWGRIVSFQNIAECAALLAHELGHIKRRHLNVPLNAYSVPGEHWFFWQRWIMGRIFHKSCRGETYEAYLYREEEEMEIEADRFMVQTLLSSLNPAHAFADLLERTGRETGLWDHHPNHPFTKMHRRRIAILRQMTQ